MTGAEKLAEVGKNPQPGDVVQVGKHTRRVGKQLVLRWWNDYGCAFDATPEEWAEALAGARVVHMAPRGDS